MADLTCAACSDPLQDDEYAKCSVNDCKLHFDCAGISENTWTTQGQVRRDTWKCKLCRTKPGGTVSQDMLGKFHDECMKKMEQVIKEQFKLNKKDFESQILELKSSVEFCSKKIDDYEKRVSAYDSKVKNLEKQNESLLNENTKIKNDLDCLKVQFEMQRQYDRNRNIEIVGLPITEGETMPEIIGGLADLIAVPLNYEADIQAAHRVATKRKTGIKPIIVQFSSRQKRDLFLKKAKSQRLKSTVFARNVPETPIYVNEHLTDYYKELLYRAKQLRAHGYKYVWPKDGKIFVRRSDSNLDKTMQLTSLLDLEKLLKPVLTVSDTAEQDKS